MCSTPLSPTRLSTASPCTLCSCTNRWHPQVSGDLRTPKREHHDALCPAVVYAFTRCKTFRMGLIRLFLSVHTQDHAPRCVIVPAFFCCRATAAADGAEARVQRLPALRVLTQCTLLPHDLSARQGRTRVALILAKRCNSSSHDVSERAQRRGGASPSLPATIHHLPLPVVITTGSHLNRIATPRCRTQLGRRRP
jgi:hypothetical protein